MAVLGTAGPGANNIFGAPVLYNFYFFLRYGAPFCNHKRGAWGHGPPLKPPLVPSFVFIYLFICTLCCIYFHLVLISILVRIGQHLTK